MPFLAHFQCSFPLQEQDGEKPEMDARESFLRHTRPKDEVNNLKEGQESQICLMLCCFLLFFVHLACFLCTSKGNYGGTVLVDSHVLGVIFIFPPRKNFRKNFRKISAKKNIFLFFRKCTMLVGAEGARGIFFSKKMFFLKMPF